MSDLQEFEMFLDTRADVEYSLELCIGLYHTWMAIYAISGFIEHYVAMTKAKHSLIEFKQGME